MVEIASLPPSPLGPELSSLPGREQRGRKGEKDVVPFGQLVSAQARPAHAQVKAQPRLEPREAPAPLDRPIEKAEKPSDPPKSRPSRAKDADEASNAAPEQQAENPAASAESKPAAESSSPETAQEASSESSENASQDDAQGGETASDGENRDENSGTPVAALADELIEIVEVSPVLLAPPVEASAETARPVAAPVNMAEVPVGTPVGLPANTVALASEGEATLDAPAAIGGTATASTATLPNGLPIPAVAAEAMSESAAEAFAKLTARAAETPVAPRAPGSEAPAKGPAAPDMPKANFGDWIHDFALAQGVHHRSGDLVGSLDRALAALPTPHAGQDALRPTPLQMLPIEIGMQAMRGVTKFQIRLDPAELGRVEVKLEFREDGQVKANLVVDRVETLAMLKRDANTLQQAFEQAGLRQSPDGLQFSLRGEGQQRDGQREGEARRQWSPDDEKLMGELPPELALRRVMIPHSSLDLMV
jgi:flagellar hook-length control protein FliK